MLVLLVPAMFAWYRQQLLTFPFIQQWPHLFFHLRIPLVSSTCLLFFLFFSVHPAKQNITAMFLCWSFTKTGPSWRSFARYVTKSHNALPWRNCHVYKYIISWRKCQVSWGPDIKVSHVKQVGLEEKGKALQKQVLLGGYHSSWPDPQWIQIVTDPCKSSGKWYPGWQAAKVTSIPQGSAN